MSRRQSEHYLDEKDFFQDENDSTEKGKSSNPLFDSHCVFEMDDFQETLESDSSAHSSYSSEEEVNRDFSLSQPTNKRDVNKHRSIIINEKLQKMDFFKSQVAIVPSTVVLISSLLDMVSDLMDHTSAYGELNKGDFDADKFKDELVEKSLEKLLRISKELKDVHESDLKAQIITFLKEQTKSLLEEKLQERYTVAIEQFLQNSGGVLNLDENKMKALIAAWWTLICDSPSVTPFIQLLIQQQKQPTAYKATVRNFAMNNFYLGADSILEEKVISAFSQYLDEIKEHFITPRGSRKINCTW